MTYAWIMVIHMHIWVLSDFIVFRQQTATISFAQRHIFTKRTTSTFRPAGGI